MRKYLCNLFLLNDPFYSPFYTPLAFDVSKGVFKENIGKEWVKVSDKEAIKMSTERYLFKVTIEERTKTSDTVLVSFCI